MILAAAVLVHHIGAARVQARRSAARVVFSTPAHRSVIPFELNSNKIYIRASVNGAAPGWFVLDSGSPNTVLDVGEVAAAHLPLEGMQTTPSGGAGELPVTQGHTVPFDMSLAGIEFHPATSQVLELDKRLAPFEGRHISGLIGGEFFAHAVVTIDYQHSRITVQDPAAYSYAGGGYVIPITVRGWMFVSATVGLADGRSLGGTFLVDTGARNALTLNTPMVNTNRLLDALPRKEKCVFGGGIGGVARHFLGRVESLSIANLNLHDVRTTFSQDAHSVFASADFQGLIGADVLKNYRVTVDYPHGRLILEPTTLSGEPLEEDGSGLFVTAEGDALRRYRVIDVVSRSPAAEAGVAVGDEVAEINGTPASSLTLEQVRTSFMQIGRSVTVGVRRHGSPVSFKLVLRRYA